jgi:exportin-T
VHGPSHVLYSTPIMQQQDLDQVVQAILIASDPSEANLHQQALQYLSTIQENANTTWRLALSLFVELTAPGTRKYPSQARFFALRVLEDFFDNR